MDNKITVIDEGGNRVELDIIDAFNIQNSQYVIVSSKDNEDAYAYKAVRNKNDVEYVSLGEGEEFNKVLEAYQSRNK